MDSAAQILSRRGYAGTRLSDIAADAEIQTSAIYYYFSSREDLVETVMERGVFEARTHVEGALTALPLTASAMDRIDAAVEAHLQLNLQLSAYATAAIRNMGQVPERIRTNQLAAERAYATLWRDLLAAAQREGAIPRTTDIRAMRMLILGALNWAPEWWHPDRGSLETAVKTAKILVRRGISGPRQPDLTPRFLPPSMG